MANPNSVPGLASGPESLESLVSLRTRVKKRPAAHADAPVTARVLPVSRPGRCAAAAGAGVFDQTGETDPFLSIDVFRRHGACIPPHPHAGCAVATYLFPESTTSMRCRNAQGGDDTLQPGDLLWLEANCGTVHDDVPEDLCKTVRGVRLVVNRAGRHAHGAPDQTVVRAAAMPQWQAGGLDLTLVCGEWGDLQVDRADRISSDETPQSGGNPSSAEKPTTLLRLDWRDDDLRTFTIPCDGRRWIALIAQGEAALAGHALRADGGDVEAMLLPPGEWQMAGRAGARLLLVGGTPLDEPVVFRGNFAARDEGDLINLMRRYQQGSMGTL
ncbi:Pirin-like protein [Pandoraea iniqua]|uniref:Pirin-like protein n=1 Tax=Pandoraea iniqua TaxID=2508288 RepID=A0A5E4ZAV0_9BURK|nr:pirin-like C-terminal cupin domain-containing protein [Pandoraea iniqua]VVE58194.1 Pirin-like protein [Pandoraea iniqua]